MATYRTPGVYVEEISLFPPSVAEVKTAVPAFIGYTEKASQRGRDLTNVPTKLRSLLEFRDRFGGPFEVEKVEVQVNEKNNHAVVGRVVPKKNFYLFEAMRLFFDNGGGECYIVSVGGYDKHKNENKSVDAATLKAGLAKVKKQDEPTIILFPDAVLLADDDEFAGLQQAALKQCADTQDRVAVFDLRENTKSDGKLRAFGSHQNEDERDFTDSVEKFRDKIGINSLKYGAAYTPWLVTSLDKDVPFSMFRDGVFDSTDTKVELDKFSSDPKLNNLVTRAITALSDEEALETRVETLCKEAGGPVLASLGDRLVGLVKEVREAAAENALKSAFKALMGWVREAAVDPEQWLGAITGNNLTRDLNTYAKDKLRSAVTGIIALEKQKHVVELNDNSANVGAVSTAYSVYDDAPTTDWLGSTAASVTALADGAFPSPGATPWDDDTKLAKAKTSALEIADALAPLIDELSAFFADVLGAATTHRDLAQTTLYQGHPVISAIVEHIEQELKRVPPSGAIAGVYSLVDRTRGVWKAPANVSLASVAEPTEPIDYFDQEDLNIDVNAGKSINAIRVFTGKGTMVWGARTLAGNDNEWRYVPVRRFFNMVEESVKKSTGWAVFEPNDAKLWIRVKSMIDNYLIQKWREGALQGAVPDDAFFVKVGLGQTMIAQDILEGRLIVEIGMAVVRPAEFIVLRFMHKMPVS